MFGTFFVAYSAARVNLLHTAQDLMTFGFVNQSLDGSILPWIYPIINFHCEFADFMRM